MARRRRAGIDKPLPMHAPSFREDHISQLPALQLLQHLGYEYLTPQQALLLRGGKAAGVLLEGVLELELERLNRIRYKGEEHAWSASNIQTGIAALRELPLQEGLMAANEHVYNLLTLGLTLEQTVAGDKKSFTLQYVDWKDWTNNAFHVTEEFSVQRAGSHEHYRPDLVLFVNGIPFAIIECKRPDIKNPLGEAISQHLRNQQPDGIRALYAFAQLLLGIASNAAQYATAGTPEKFWSRWREQHDSPEAARSFEAALRQLKNRRLSVAQKERLFSERYGYVRHYFEQLEQAPLELTEQDRYLYALCRPERLLDLTFSGIVFDEGAKKIARYQQYFAIKKAMQRLLPIENGRRQGGVIWHTQGSGKSLTMVMLAQALALEKRIRNPKIVIVTDRVDLDDQIAGTFKKCALPVRQAHTGKHLLELLDSKSDAVITTIINKFETAVKQRKAPFASPDIFVLVDEGHRSQHGLFNLSMEKVFPNACFIAFTGTPLRKKEKNTAQKFGGMIDAYTVAQAVQDQAVVPLLYEGRHAIQEVNERPLDTYFSMVSEPFTEQQRADMKRKFSRADQLNQADQKIYTIAWDISRHFRDYCQGTGFKAQLVCPNKATAIKYKQYLDEIGYLSSEVLISPPDEREGSDSAYEESPDLVQRFWRRMMQEHGNAKAYEKNLINRFKKAESPELIIVVDKLLTGFDAPINRVLYLTRSLREHSLLQAIARVNRVYPGKDHGLIIDYYGVLAELDEALKTYASFEGFEAEDLAATVANIAEEIKKLPQAHSELWDFFKAVPNPYDAAAYEEALRQEDVRQHFYEKLSSFARLLGLALSSADWHRATPEQQQERYKYDLGFFSSLRLAVRQRFSDIVDFKAYEAQIQKLIDQHVTSHEVLPVTELVNIFDQEQFEQEVEKTLGTAAQADLIAHRTAKHINERMEEDPAFYKRFSEMVKEAIRAYAERRLSEADYLQRARELQAAVLNRTDSTIPETLRGREIAQAFFGISFELFKAKLPEAAGAQALAVEAGLGIDDIIRRFVLDQGQPKVDWQHKSNLLGQMEIAIGDFLIDHIRGRDGLELSFGEIGDIAAQYLDIAKLRYR